MPAPTVERSVDAGALAEVLESALEETVEIAEIRQLRGGASRETHRVQVRIGRGPDPIDIAVQFSQRWAIDFTIRPSVEASVIQEAGAAGVPVAPVVASDDGDGVLGRPFLATRFVDGESRSWRLSGDGDASRTLGRAYADGLSAIQSVPVDALAQLPAIDPLEWADGLLAEVGTPRPVLQLGLRWLENNRPPTASQVLVHGDYRNGNGVVDADGLRAILDWETAHVGDRYEDLAWFCLRAWRYGREPGAGGLTSIEDFAGRYADRSGQPIDPGVLHWWAVYGTVRWGLLCLVEGATHTTGARPSMELAVVGRRVVEAEHDLLLLLDARESGQ